MSLSRSAVRAANVFVLSVALAACFGDSRAQQAVAPAPRSPAAVPTLPVGSPVLHALPDFAPLVERYGPAVVNVTVVEKAQPAAQGGQGSEDDPFNDFFKRFGIPAPDFGGHGQQQQPMRGEGSGFITSPDGYILTNAHVVADADEVTVRLTDRREFTAKVIGIDARSDVAVIKIDANNLPIVKIGNPSLLKPGQWVLAIGSPFGFENSATAGIVSATARSLPGESGSSYVPFIQTDVPVNPGNSGGPLFNMNGEVVGINSQIFSRTGGYMGLSFAIPIDVVMNVRDQLVKTGHVTRGRIGVTIQEVNAQFADSFGLDRPRGALVSSVETAGPGEKAGLKAGDVILAVNGRLIERSSELPTVIAEIKPGTDVRLSVWRDRKADDVPIKIGLLDDKPVRTASRNAAHQTDAASRLGLAVRPLAPEEKQQVDTEGTLVVEQATGPAAEAGVEPGDIILGVNGKKVKSVAELESAAKGAGKTVALLIQREGQQIFLPLHVS